MALTRQVLSRWVTRMSVYVPSRSFQKNSTLMKDWQIGKLNHIAIAVTDLDKAVSLYKDVLGAKVSSKMDLPEHGVTTVFVELGDTKIEVDNIQKAIKDLRSKNIRLLSENAKIGAHGNPVIFAHPKDCDGVLVEFEQFGGH